MERRMKKFKNGDWYEGGWKNGLPEGPGKYVWTDGSTYDGYWKSGMKHGNGEYIWPSNARYAGEWQKGCMHGYGQFIAADGSKYKGGWSKDFKHGLGKKVYSNGDKYEGIWKQGKPDGPGRYVWADGNDYNGEWKAGRMHGHGTFQWKTGERYDGEWKDGRESGLGTFQWKDNATYNGLWYSGKKHGIGIFRPAPLDNKRSTTVPTDAQDDDAYESISSSSSSVAESIAGNDEVGDGPVSAPSIGRKAAGRTPAEENMASTASSENVLLREYQDGKLIYEEAIMTENKSDMELLLALFKREEGPGKFKKLFVKDNDMKTGQVIYKGHSSYDLMVNLQLGIQYSVGRINTIRLPEGLKDEHFRQKVKIDFPRRGSTQTPPHMSNDFKWKDYAPMVFQKLRESYGVDPADYLISLCGNQALRELPSPGKSGSIFYLSHDDRFIIKTMKPTEMQHLFSMLKKYYNHMITNSHTLVTKFYGLHRVTPLKGPKIRFMVMNNLFRTDLPIHRKYDLKGSTQGRFTNPKDLDASSTLKDLDLESIFKLEQTWNEQLHRQLDEDCQLLRSMNVMDYSLLLGVHYRKKGFAAIPELREGESEQEEKRFNEKCRAQIRSLNLDERRAKELLKLVELKLQSRKTMRTSPQQALVKNPKRNPTMRPVGYEGGTDALNMFLGYDRVHLGRNMIATAVKKMKDTNELTDEVEDVVVYFGIIDILQDYNYQKKVEHGIKSLYNDASQISAVEPQKYSSRFLKFMKVVFQ